MNKFSIFLMFRHTLNEASSCWEKKQNAEYHWSKTDSYHTVFADAWSGNAICESVNSLCARNVGDTTVHQNSFLPLNGSHGQGRGKESDQIILPILKCH